MFMDWKTYYCLHGSATQIDLQIQSNPYQNSNGLFCRNGKVDPQIHTELQKAQIAKKS